MKGVHECYDNMDMESSRVATSDQRKYLRYCVQLAGKSNVTHKHGCVIVDRKTKEIISHGFNYDYKNHVKVNSLHAEMAAIRNANKRCLARNDCEMYVVRMRNSRCRNIKEYELKYSKPCEVCAQMIMSRTNIRNIYYSTNHSTV